MGLHSRQKRHRAVYELRCKVADYISSPHAYEFMWIENIWSRWQNQAVPPNEHR